VVKISGTLCSVVCLFVYQHVFGVFVAPYVAERVAAYVADVCCSS